MAPVTKASLDALDKLGFDSNYRKGSISKTRMTNQYIETLKWITDNYEIRDGLCIPRHEMYDQYTQYCSRIGFVAAGAAAFGKIVRHRFPDLTTRRLGTRGQSKYHYFGISLKSTSAIQYTSTSTQRQAEPKLEPGSKLPERIRKRPRTQLCRFPEISDFDLPPEVNKEQVDTFLVMYRTHCQRMMDIVSTTDFQQVKLFLEHFWLGIPNHLTSLLYTEFAGDLVAVCDLILYKAIKEMLIPSVDWELPESFRKDIASFASSLGRCLESSLRFCPVNFRTKKMQAGLKFVKSIKRELQCNYLSQACRELLVSADNVKKLVGDLENIDQKYIFNRLNFLEVESSDNMTQVCLKFYKGLIEMLHSEEAITVEIILLSTDRLFTAYCAGGGSERHAVFTKAWFYFLSMLTEDLTLRSTDSFAIFQLLRVLLEEYVLLTTMAIFDKREFEGHLETLQKYSQSKDLFKKPIEQGSSSAWPASGYTKFV